MRLTNKISIAALLAMASTSIATQANEVSLSYYDFRGTGVLFNGKLYFNERLSGTLDIGETDFSTVRAGVSYQTDLALGSAPVHLVGGYSNYDSTSGAWFGAGVRHGLTPELNSKAELIHDTAGDGFRRLNFGLDYALSGQFLGTGGYSVNTDRVSNEFRIGMSYRF